MQSLINLQLMHGIVTHFWFLQNLLIKIIVAGVTSFSIDLPTKKVTVIGDVTPLGVLSSVSKVKNAQLWPSPTSSSSPWSA